MPVLMGNVEINDLAQRLAKMRFNRAKGYVRSLDKKGRLDIFRVVVGSNEWHTRYTLPTRNLRITLIERAEYYGEPSTRGHRKTRFKYLEARVEPIPENLRPHAAEEPEEALFV